MLRCGAHIIGLKQLGHQKIYQFHSFKYLGVVPLRQPATGQLMRPSALENVDHSGERFFVQKQNYL
jgi:hypothetical protein